jgi:hypothetical protein
MSTFFVSFIEASQLFLAPKASSIKLFPQFTREIALTSLHHLLDNFQDDLSSVW